jgi:nucleotide-binding universal stress UspA family protein
MSLKSILAVVGGEDDGRRVLELAASLTVSYAAHMEAFHVSSTRPSGLPDVPPEFSPQLREETRVMLLARSSEREQRAHSLFEEICRRHALVHAEPLAPAATLTARWHAIAGDAATHVAERGRVFDLIVVDPRGGATGEPSDRSVESALFGTGRPVLLAASSAPAGLFQRPLVAWNRGLLAARALAAALPLLERARRAVIVYAETQAKAGPSPEEAADYLARHGVHAEISRLAVGRESVGAMLLRAARDANADLLVMGAAYRSRVRELLFGGVTGHMLRHASIPVLMAH